jgi:hypothetical protein
LWVLVTLLVVGASGAVFWWVRTDTMRGETEQWLVHVGNAVAMYGLYFSDKPWSFAEGDRSALEAWIRADRDLRKAIYWRRVDEDLGPLVDAWGQPLVYRYPARRQELVFELYSVGPNGVDEQGEGDDIPCGATALRETWSKTGPLPEQPGISRDASLLGG